MNYDELKTLMDNGLSQRKIAKQLNLSQTSVRYWIKKFKIQKIYKNIKNKICPKCQISKSLKEFYNRRGKLGGSVYCKQCTGRQAIDRQRDFKKKCVEYKGSSCSICGYSRCDAALEFHHQDPKEKDFSISHIRLTSFNERTKKELDKCILVCANCHRELHFSLLQ